MSDKWLHSIQFEGPGVASAVGHFNTNRVFIISMIQVQHTIAEKPVIKYILKLFYILVLDYFQLYSPQGKNIG